ncbi:MAG: hypothetical protein KDD67_16660 [Ignavibacteriae bacterium]|nr:hypothetical protein [Ignavibacteriota bacterium]MCB9217363.1 hypothetical protein [Ignavibacteria bacterium]
MQVRFGVMCSGLTFPKWQANAIEMLLALDGVECALLIVDGREAKNKEEGGWRLLKTVPFRNYLWLGYSWFLKRRSVAEKPTTLQHLFAKVPSVKVEPYRKGKFTELFSDEDVQQIEEYNLDFILRFGFGIIRGDILNAARHGVWSFHHDDEQTYRGGPPCFWEIYHRDRVTGAILQRLTDRLDAGIVLRKGYLKTKGRYLKNRDQLFLESSRWPALVCRNLLDGYSPSTQRAPSETSAPIYHAPTNSQFLRYLFLALFSTVRSIYRGLLYVDLWNIGVVEAPIEEFLKSEKPEPVKWFPLQGKERFVADPFWLKSSGGSQGKRTLLYEEFFYRRGKGSILRAEYLDGGFTAEREVISATHHLSYPFLFEWDGETYMIPETWEAGEVALYRATAFPESWEKVSVLIPNFAGVDSTIINYNGYFWVYTVDKKDGPHYNLKLFFAKDIAGEWHPHPQNPVKTDIRSVRPAGTPFLYEGELYRPAMDYSEKIEGRIQINRVIELTTTTYREEVVQIVNPYVNSEFPDKIHTLCAGEGETLIDGCREVLILTNPGLIRYKLKTIADLLR